VYAPAATHQTKMIFLKNRHHNSHRRNAQTIFTPSFFRFLFGFVGILAASFALLAYLTLRIPPDTAPAPGVNISTPCSESQLSQEKC